MPNIRRLSWRDRRVWTLTQTMTGEGSGSPPFQFPASGAGQFVVSMTEAEWVEVFSALMTGADLSYPDKSHQVVWNLLRNLEFPVSLVQRGSYAFMPAYAWTATAGGALAVTANTVMWLNILGQQATPAINNIIVTEYYTLQAGDYRWRYIYNKNNSSGIATFLARRTIGTTIAFSAAVDHYAAVSVNNQVALGNFTLTTAENFNFERAINSKNAASSGYNAPFSMLEIWRED